MIGGFVHVVTPQNKVTNASCNSLTQNVTLTQIVTTFDAKCNDFFNSNSNNFLTHKCIKFFDTKCKDANEKTLVLIYKRGKSDLSVFFSTYWKLALV